jgi:hypothetical protein
LRTSDLWTKLTAVGTLTVSIVALLIAVVPPLWRRYWKRPRLVVLIGAAEPWTRVAFVPGGPTYVWFRMQVVNDGRAEARNLRAVVHEWYERADANAEWHKRDLDPSALHWVSMSYQWEAPRGGGEGSIKRETAPVVSLPQGLSDFADLVRYGANTNEHTLVLDDPRPRGFADRPRNLDGEFVLSVTVAAENARTVTKHIHYTLSRERFFSDVRFEKGPPGDYLFPEILTTIEQMKRQEGQGGAL